MIKKITSIAAVLAVTTGVAMASPAPYVGAGLGIVANTANDTNAMIGGFRGAPLSLLAGYGGLISDAYTLAGEVNATLLTGTLSGRNTLKTSYGYGISILPGYMLSDTTQAFLRAGFVRAEFSQNDNYVSGGQLGLGLQTAVMQHVDVRGEYDFTAYRSFRTMGSSVAPRQDAATLSLIYKFD